MDIAILLVLILHFIGLAGIVGGWLAVVKAPRMNKGILHGSILALVTGLILVTLRELQDLSELNHMKVGIKLLIAVAVVVVAVIGVRKEAKAEGSSAALAHTAGALGMLNIAIAVLMAPAHA